MSDSSIIPAARLSDVNFSFGAVSVLNGLNFAAKRGEAAALIGPSGAGKTSLLALVAGLLRPVSGEVEVLGQSLAGLDEDALATMRREKIGVVFQHFHLLETMTALENAALPLQLLGDDNAFDRAAESLRAVGLAERTSHFPAQLSGGERQRTAIARAFVARPQLLLADEPTGNLDYDSGQAVLDLLLGMARDHQSTLLFVTHNQDILKRFDSVHVLRGGALHPAE